MTVDLTDPMFHDDDAARAHFEALLWPNGPVCPHCGAVEGLTRLQGASHRAGMFQCNACRGNFTVTNGSVMERSHVPLHKWALAFHLMAASKKGVSAHQLHRMLKLNYRTAWFMEHRIREAMRDDTVAPIGGSGKTVESDETFIGMKKGFRKQRGGGSHKNVVLTLVERGGKARSFHIARASVPDIAPIVRANIDRESRLMTDEAKHYDKVGADFDAHETVNHAAGEYVRGDAFTNTVESYFSVFKRGMKGIYQHCGEQHLHRYLAEFDFRHSNRVRLGVDDTERAKRAIRGAKGKRLMYQQPTAG